MWTIYVDKSREKKLSEQLRLHPFVKQQQKCHFEEIRLTHGDVQVFYRHQLIFIMERKRILDLTSSKWDGRMYNLENLQDLAETNKLSLSDGKNNFQPLVFLMIEGRFRRASRRCESKSQLERHLNEWRFQIPRIQIVRTDDAKSTSNKIIELIQSTPMSLQNEINVLKKKTTANTTTTVTSPSIPFIVTDTNKKRPLTDNKENQENKTKKTKKTNSLSVKESEEPSYALQGNQKKLHFRFLRHLQISINVCRILLESKWTALDVILGNISESDLLHLRYQSGAHLKKSVMDTILSFSQDEKTKPEEQVNILVQIINLIPYVKRNPSTAKIMAEIYLSLPDTNRKYEYLNSLVLDPRCKELNRRIVTRIWKTLTYQF